MGIFDKPRFLGIDFGTASLKAVEVEYDGKSATLVNFGEADFSTLGKQLGSVAKSYDEAIALYLRALLEKMLPGADRAHVAMPAYTGLISLIEMPVMAPGELADAIQFEAHKHVPTSLEEVSLSWEVVGSGSGASAGADGSRPMQEVLLVAALKKEIARYRGYVEAQGMTLALLELETFSLVRSLVGNRPGAHLLLDIGSRATNMVLVEEGKVKVSRNIDVGGKDLTRTLSESMNIGKDRAEELKRSGKDFLNNPESALIFPALELIVSEARRVLESHTARTGRQIETLLVSGGTAKLTGLKEYLERLIGRPVQFSNPWESLVVLDVDKPTVAELGTSYAIAIGLALGGIEAGQQKKKENSGSFGERLRDMFTKKIG